MRATEFVSEGRKGKMTKRQRWATTGVNTFIDPSHTDRFYELNRIMMAAACTDGDIIPELNGESWAGRDNTAHPYTEVEQRMLQKAYKAIGSDVRDLNGGDLRSQELPDTNTQSTVKPFKGYKKK